MSLAFEDLEIGTQVPQLSRVVTREDIAAYAEVSGDRNPLHLSDEAARARGFDGIIAHGMLTLAHLITCLTDWVGDPTLLEHIKANFRAAVRAGDTMVAGGEVTGLDEPARTAKLDVWVRVDHVAGGSEEAIRRSVARLKFSQRPASR